MAVTLKTDFFGKGKWAAVANALNAIGIQLNGANVPSGGTAELTPTGLQIEVDTGAPYNFEVLQTDLEHVEVRGGSWAYYEAEVREQVDLATAGADYNETSGELTTITADSVIYLELDLTEEPGTLTAKSDTDAAWGALDDEEDIYRKKIATIVWDDASTPQQIGSIEQNWRGGNILWGLDDVDIEHDHSFHWDAESLTISAGNYTQEGDGGDYAAVTFPTMPLLTLPLSTRYYIAVVWDSVTPGLISSVTLTNGATTPTNSEFVWFVDVMEFDSVGVCTERLQSDLILPKTKAGDTNEDLTVGDCLTMSPSPYNGSAASVVDHEDCQGGATDQSNSGNSKFIQSIQFDGFGHVDLVESDTVAASGITGATSVTVVTDVRYDTTTHQIQKKTRTIDVLSAGTESGWTLITGGQASECDDT